MYMYATYAMYACTCACIQCMYITYAMYVHVHVRMYVHVRYICNVCTYACTLHVRMYMYTYSNVKQLLFYLFSVM